jgi:uncharacterized protein YdcH (DUF465 family)
MADAPVVPSYQQLADEHHSLDVQLQHLAALPYLPHALHLKEVALKKMKLALKDRMAALQAGHQGVSTHS